ncbi:Mitogen-activated protein kinase kinase kinase 3 [Glycine soja]
MRSIQAFKKIESLCSLDKRQSEQDEASCLELLECVSKSKRHLDRDLDNPKPCKSRKSISSSSLLSCKYNKISFCGIEDHVSDGFYDAGRDRLFMPVECYEQNHCLASREVILLDRKFDEELDAVMLAAQALYLCDHMAPPGPCELVRGYLHFSPHAWNIILIKRGATWVQMLIDACRPLDIRQEKDPEYFCRGLLKHRVLRSAIFMEYVEGGSLKNYLEKLSEAGEKHVPVELALHIAKDVSCALSELHSKHIIHRDIKSENILFDLDRKRDDGTPTMKLCHFDSAVPLRSTLHVCCIAHAGTRPPCICVGTPRWMAPEEANIWLFGCLLLEMLTLQIPYSGLSDSHFLDSLQMGKRPQLTDELRVLSSMNGPTMIPSGEELEKSDAGVDMLKFLVDLFHKCVEQNPSKYVFSSIIVRGPTVIPFKFVSVQSCSVGYMLKLGSNWSLKVVRK